MEIIIFIAGFMVGGIAVYIPFWLSKKSEAKAKDVLLEQMKLQFENVANMILREGSRELGERNQADLEGFYKRFKDRIEDFEKRAEENFKSEAEKFTQFDSNIKTFIEAGNRISQDANSLVRVMRSDNRTQGHWGEIVLERVLELSGLRKGEEYEVQCGMSEGRPDATIFLPEGRRVYIDAKTSFASWDGYVNAGSEAEKAEYLKQFTESVRTHITGLSKRGYSGDEYSPDYVLMFIPIEGCYAKIFCNDCSLWDMAWRNGVMPVSPSTLLAALKIINSFYTIERQNKNAQEISRICSEMLDKVAGLAEDMLGLQRGFDKAMKKLSGRGNIITQINRIEELGCRGRKRLPDGIEQEEDV